MTKESSEKPNEPIGRPIPAPVCVTPVKEETKPIATTPKLRGKRNVNQPECEKPQDEYSAEADDEMEEEIKLCNKKKLMVALKDINADKKLVEGSSVKTYSLEQREKPMNSLPMANHSSPSKFDTNAVQSNNSPSAEKSVTNAAEISDKSISDRHSVAVAKKTKKQKIIENDVENVDFDERKRDEFKPNANERTEELKNYETNEKSKSDGNDTNIGCKAVTSTDVLIESGSAKHNDDDDDDAGSANELGSDDMEICDDTTNTTNAYEPLKFSPSKCAYPKLENTNTDSNPVLRDSHATDKNKEPSNPIEHKTSEAVMRQSSTFPTISPTKTHEKWTNDCLRVAESSTSQEINSIVVAKTNESVDNQSPVKSSGSNSSPSKVHEDAVKPANNELRPNVIVDAQSEIKEPPQQHVSPVKNDQMTETNEPEQKEKQISPAKTPPNVVNPKTSPSDARATNEPKADVTEKEPSPSKTQSNKNATTDLDTDVDANKSRSPANRTEHISPREKLQNQTKLQSSPEKSRDSMNSVIKSVIEPNPGSSDCVPLSGSTIDVSKNDETKTTTQDFCQRIDPNKTPQCAESTTTKMGKSETKVETKHEPFKMDQSSPLVTPSSMEKSHRMPVESVKTPPKESIIQPKEEPNRTETTNTPIANTTNGNQQNEMAKNRYKQQQSHSTKQGHLSSKSQTGNDHSKKNTSTSCSSQTSHFDIKRESKPEIKSNAGYANESAMRRESPTKRDSNKQSTGYGSSASSKNFASETASMNSSKSSMSSGSSSSQSGSDKKHGNADKKSTAVEKKSNSAEKKPTEMRGNIDADLNKMRPQFTMNQLPNYHTAHQYYNLSPWDPYNYHSGYNLPHLDPSATQKSPTKFHKDLANSMYGGMTSNYLAANTLAAQQSQQQQVRFGKK